MDVPTDRFHDRQLHRRARRHAGDGVRRDHPGSRPHHAEAGGNFRATSAATVRYRAFLAAKHARLLQRVGATAYHDYTVAFNGFAAHLTGRQAQTLAKQPGVLAVQKDALRKPRHRSVAGVPRRHRQGRACGPRSAAGRRPARA